MAATAAASQDVAAAQNPAYRLASLFLRRQDAGADRPLTTLVSYAAMNPDARTLWQAPSWGLAVLLACLGMLGPFSIDTYLPAFTGIARAIGASPVEMQQTLSAYLFGFAVMNLFHGALSDSFGRRPVVLGGIVLFTLASSGCGLSER